MLAYLGEGSSDTCQSRRIWSQALLRRSRQGCRSAGRTFLHAVLAGSMLSLAFIGRYDNVSLSEVPVLVLEDYLDKMTLLLLMRQCKL